MDLLDKPHPLRPHLYGYSLLDSPETTQTVELEEEAGLTRSPRFHDFLSLDYLPVTCFVVG